MRFSAIILLSVVLAFACKKKNEDKLPEESPAAILHDTLKPLPYLPVYPGSYWKYSNGRTDSVPPGYVKDAYSIRSFQGVVYQSDTMYVPLYGGFPIWGYKKHDEGAIASTDQTHPLASILSDNLALGSGWTRSFRSHYGEYARIITKDTSLTIGGKEYFPTLVVHYYWVYNSGAWHHDALLYYCRDVGLIKVESLQDQTGAVTGEMHLVDYFINK